jgi:hypothetical protein
MTDMPDNTAEPPPGATAGQLPYGGDTYAILGACFAVYTDKGCGFLEAVYQECLEIELRARGIPFVAQEALWTSVESMESRLGGCHFSGHTGPDFSAKLVHLAFRPRSSTSA